MIFHIIFFSRNLPVSDELDDVILKYFTYISLYFYLSKLEFKLLCLSTIVKGLKNSKFNLFFYLLNSCLRSCVREQLLIVEEILSLVIFSTYYVF